MPSSTDSFASPLRAVHSVTVVARRIKQLLEGELPPLWIQGELSNFVRSAAGHWYFTLKDEKSQLRCVMFRNRTALVRAPLKEGDAVLVCGSVGLYEGRGDLQILVDHLEPTGSGALQFQFEALKQKLFAQGLFDASHKQKLPTLPNRIGVITSSTGAAIHDILTVLQRRAPQIEVDIFPVLVQGPEAAGQIAHAIELANRDQNTDLLIVGRGGGSLEDLWAFNEEIVARAIHASHIPIISAVGHEIDFSIADLVADLRAPTPSAAAEIASAAWLEIPLKLDHFLHRTQRWMSNRLMRSQAQLNFLSKRLLNPKQQLNAKIQLLDSLQMRLDNSLKATLTEATHQLKRDMWQLNAQSPHRRIQRTATRLEAQQEKLHQCMQSHLYNLSQTLKRDTKLLQAIGPQQTLERGYAIVMTEKMEIVRDPIQVSLHEHLHVRVARGEFTVTTAGD